MEKNGKSRIPNFLKSFKIGNSRKFKHAKITRFAVLPWCFRCVTNVVGNAPNCSEEAKIEIDTAEYCAAIRDTESVFGACTADEDIDAEMSYTQCEFDLCAVYRDVEVMKNSACGHLERLSEACAEEGYPIANWRDTYNCRTYNGN